MMSCMLDQSCMLDESCVLDQSYMLDQLYKFHADECCYNAGTRSAVYLDVILRRDINSFVIRKSEVWCGKLVKTKSYCINECIFTHYFHSTIVGCAVS